MTASAQPSYRQAALEAARWIRASTIHTPQGAVWPADPNKPESVSYDLYHGTPGVVLFFLEAYRTTGDKTHLEAARAGADALVAHLAEQKDAGLYTGLSGMGFALYQTYRQTNDTKYLEGALRSIELIYKLPPTETTDIISGSAGTGLYLLYMARELRHPAALELAAKLGRRLLEAGQKEGPGMKWAMDSKFPRLMPNFSHGTAGVAYFLATLSQQLDDPLFRTAAVAGAKYLESIATTECLVYHHEPGGEKLHYLGWCHGPVGTSRLFYRLSQMERGPTWMNWITKSAQAIMASGIPEKQTAGFWNNISQCCGSAGVAEYFLDLYGVTRKAEYLQFAKRVARDLLSRATKSKDGLSWVQAENRTEPKNLVAQTGYMQGAAGAGMLFLHMDAMENGKKDIVRLPDDPF